MSTATADPALRSAVPEKSDRSAISPAIAAGLAAIAIGVALRFMTHSAPWVDESADIAGVPLGQIPSALRTTGAPPLYYYLLHGWMSLLGTSDMTVRALGAVFSIASLPLAWFAGQRIGGRPAACVAVLFFATSPFALTTQSQMYSLVIFLVLLGYLVLGRALDGPSPAGWVLPSLALISGVLMLTHYWSLYLLPTVVGLLVAKALMAGQGQRRRYLKAAGAVSAGGLLFLPWLSDFVYQSVHTGSLWADPASFSATVNAVSVFAGGGSSAGRALGLTFFALAGLGLLGTALDSRRVKLDLRTRPAGRGVALVTAGTLGLAIAAGVVTRGAFTDKYTPLYTAVVFPPFLLLAALGTAVFQDRRIREAVIGATAAFGLVACIVIAHP